MTRQAQVDHELDAVRALLAARREAVLDVRRSENDHEDADVIATLRGGRCLRVEVGRIMDAATYEREREGVQAQDDLLREFCAAVRATGEEPPGVHVAVEFSGAASTKVRKRIVKAVIAYTAGTARPSDWTPIEPLPNGVARLEIKYSPVGAKAFHVPTAGAFFPQLHRLVDAKAAKPYASKGDVTLLAVVPTLQPWMRGPWLDDAVADLRERRGNSAAPFMEIVGLDETTREMLFTIP